MNRILYIQHPAYLRLRNNQMLVIRPKDREEIASIPSEDIGYLILDHHQITLTFGLIQELSEKKVVVIHCDKQHLPQSIHLPLAGHSEHTERIRLQTSMSPVLQKNLWRQVVQSKIYNQAMVLSSLSIKYKPLIEMRSMVQSGDATNREGSAAKWYWRKLFNGFIRDRYGESPNNLLNYGYAILRSIIARAISSTGLHLALGIHHKNKYNALCLADDMMEPYRPFVDAAVHHWVGTGERERTHWITPSFKKYILQLVNRDVYIEDKQRPLQIAATMTSASLWHCIKGERRKLRLPEYQNNEN